MNKILLSLSLAGLAFSGYLSSVKFFSGTCAFGESCPYFLGYPACYFGFMMYCVLTALSLLIVLRGKSRSLIDGMFWVASLGILFAGYFTLYEIPVLFSEGLRAYMLGLPTCALGLIFYTAIAIVSYKNGALRSGE